jgi:hypothetical protein
LAAVVAVLAVPAAPAAARSASRCATLPVTPARTTTDPVTFQDAATMTVRPAAPVRDLRVALRHGSRTFAAGAVAGVVRKAAVVRLRFRRGLQGGGYRLTITGRRVGCAGRGKAGRDWRFAPVSLPVIAGRPSAYVEDYHSSLRVVLRSVGGRSVRDLSAALLDHGGSVITQGTRAKAFARSAVLDLPLSAPLQPGSYRLRIIGRSGGAAGTLERVQPIALRSSAGSTALPETGATSDGSSGLVSQHVTIDWGDGAHDGRDTAGFEIPGLGYGEVVCRPDAEWLRVFSGVSGREIAMMNWVRKDWVSYGERALREAVLTPTSGTEMNEGFNKFGPPEKQSTGSFDGIISDRGAFGSPGGAGVAPTTISLVWSWDFTQTGRERCAVSATFVTAAPRDKPPLARSLSIAWRGDANAAGHDGATAIVPGLGRVDATCAAGPDGVRWVTITGPGGAAVTTRQGSDETTTQITTGPVAVPLPNNGMLRFAFPGGGSLVMSSRWKVNDPEPASNFCFVAAQAVQP